MYTMVNSDELPLMLKERTYPIHLAMMDYSRLLYGERSLEIMCAIHGTLSHSQLDPDGEEEEAGEHPGDDDDDTPDTVGTNESDDSRS